MAKNGYVKHLKGLANYLKTLGEKQKEWEQKQIKWQKNKPPFNDFLYYIALATVWQTFSKKIKGEKRIAFVEDIYKTFKLLLKNRSFEIIEEVLRSYKASRFMVGINLLKLWLNIIKKIREKKLAFNDPLIIQKIAESCSSRTQHWLIYAPLEAAIVVGEIFPPLKEIIPPLGQTVIKGFSLLGLNFSYPPTRKELEIIHEYLLYLAQLANTNHLIIEMGIWLLGSEDQDNFNV